MSSLKIAFAALTDVDRALLLDLDSAADFEFFLKIYLKMQGDSGGQDSPSAAFLKASTTMLLHTISESEKASYVTHINSYLGVDQFLKQFLLMDHLSNDLFEISKNGVLLCKLINVAVPGTIDERAINTKRVLNPWERNENHTLCLNSVKAIGCIVVNIGTWDLVEGWTKERYTNVHDEDSAEKVANCVLGEARALRIKDNTLERRRKGRKHGSLLVV